MDNRYHNMSASELLYLLTSRKPTRAMIAAAKKRSEQLSAEAYRLQRLIIALEDTIK